MKGTRYPVKWRLIFVMAGLAALYLASLAASNDPGGLAGLVHVGAAPAMAVSGEWTGEISEKHPGQIQLNFSRHSDKEGYNGMMGETFKTSDLQGFTADISPTKTDMKFSLVREAGTISCEGAFKDGRGSGFWTFTADATFAAAMRQRGFNGLTDDDMLRAAFHNLTTKYADEIRVAGYDKLTFDELSRAAGHEITIAYIQELGQAGYEHLSMEDLIRASNHEIDAAYIREVRAMGFDKQPLETIIRLRNHEITPDFIAKMRSAGFGDLSIDDLIRLQNHEITPEFVAEIKAEGFTEVSADLAIRLKNHDVDGNFIRRAKAQGYPNATLDEMIRLSNKGLIK